MYGGIDLGVSGGMGLPPELAAVAYHDGPLPIGFDKTISQPFIVALIVDLLDIQAEDSILEVGTGRGYQTAVLAQLARHVWSIDIVEEFVEIAQSRMVVLDENVTLRARDGSRGWASPAPFDKIIVAAAADEPPARLLEQLNPGGRLVIPLGGVEVQQITLIAKVTDCSMAKRQVIPAKFSRLE